MQARVLTLAAFVLAVAAVAAQQKPPVIERPETILVNGKVLSADAKFTIYEAVAVTGDHIQALGTSKDMRALSDAKTRIIDLGGRTVIPGLTDSHMHAIRAGLSFATEVHWIGAPTIENALGR